MMRLATSAWTMKVKPFTFDDSQVTETLTNIGELHQITYNNEGKRRKNLNQRSGQGVEPNTSFTPKKKYRIT